MFSGSHLPVLSPLLTQILRLFSSYRYTILSPMLYLFICYWCGNHEVHGKEGLPGLVKEGRAGGERQMEG